MVGKSIKSIHMRAAVAGLILIILGVSGGPAPASARDSATYSAQQPGGHGSAQTALSGTAIDTLMPAEALGVQSISQNHFAQGGSTVRDAGAEFLHMAVMWRQLAPTDRDPATFDWSKYDTTLADANTLGYQVMVTLGDNPFWAATYDRGPINCVPLSRFTDYVTAVVTRYSASPYNVKYWEIYNEPDPQDQTAAQVTCLGDYVAHSFGEHPDDYVDTLHAAYDAIKAVDPDAVVLLGGLAHDWFVSDGGQFVESFPDDILALGAADYFDAFNFHSYGFPQWETETGLPGLRAKTKVMLDLMHSYGVYKPIVITEFGQGSESPHTEDTQAIAVIKMFTQAIAAGNKIGIWYNMNDYNDPYGYAEFGLLDYPSFDPKLSLSAFETLATYLPGFAFNRVLSTTAMGATNLEGYVFWDTANGKILNILWSADGSSQTITLPPGVTSVVDKFDNPVSHGATLGIDEQPVLISQDWTFGFLHLPIITK